MLLALHLEAHVHVHVLPKEYGYNRREHEVILNFINTSTGIGTCIFTNNLWTVPLKFIISCTNYMKRSHVTLNMMESQYIDRILLVT